MKVRSMLPALARLQAQLDGVRGQLDLADPLRASCDALLELLGAPA